MVGSPTFRLNSGEMSCAGTPAAGAARPTGGKWRTVRPPAASGNDLPAFTAARIFAAASSWLWRIASCVQSARTRSATSANGLGAGGVISSTITAKNACGLPSAGTWVSRGGSPCFIWKAAWIRVERSSSLPGIGAGWPVAVLPWASSVPVTPARPRSLGMLSSGTPPASRSPTLLARS